VQKGQSPKSPKTSSLSPASSRTHLEEEKVISFKYRSRHSIGRSAVGTFSTHNDVRANRRDQQISNMPGDVGSRPS